VGDRGKAAVRVDAAANLRSQLHRRDDRQLIEAGRNESIQNMAHDRPIGDPPGGSRIFTRPPRRALRGNNYDSLTRHGDTTASDPARSRGRALFRPSDRPLLAQHFGQQAFHVLAVGWLVKAEMQREERMIRE
jgi:hypothetical protein